MNLYLSQDTTQAKRDEVMNKFVQMVGIIGDMTIALEASGLIIFMIRDLFTSHAMWRLSEFKSWEGTASSLCLTLLAGYLSRKVGLTRKRAGKRPFLLLSS